MDGIKPVPALIYNIIQNQEQSDPGTKQTGCFHPLTSFHIQSIFKHRDIYVQKLVTSLPKTIYTYSSVVSFQLLWWISVVENV